LVGNGQGRHINHRDALLTEPLLQCRDNVRELFHPRVRLTDVR